MYAAVVLLTTLVLPALSIAVEVFLDPAAAVLALIGKWFVFWGVGVRLLLAGLSQALRPSFTARGILAIADPAAEKVVAELGFANVAMGLTAALSLAFPAWTPAGALLGGIFLGAAGVKHALNLDRTAKENLAMATDILVAAMAFVYLVSLAAV